MKLALGTVQFGLKYGIANQSGKPGRAEVSAILALAQTHGIATLDTAISYGDAEAVLGTLIDGASWRIITKLPPLPPKISASEVRAWCLARVRSSMNRLGTTSLEGVLLHRPQDLIESRGAALATALRTLKDVGLTKATGVSVYVPAEIDRIAAERPDAFRTIADIVQAPLNVFDRELETSGWAARLSDAGVRIHLRSAFLQGLLIMPPERVPAQMQRFRPDIQIWWRWLAETGQEPLAAALRLPLSRPFAEHVIVGTESARQLADLLAAVDCDGPVPEAALVTTDSALRDPRQWTRR